MNVKDLPHRTMNLHYCTCIKMFKEIENVESEKIYIYEKNNKYISQRKKSPSAHN